ncbi:asparagine--tRNA ligase [Candidatus Falkowbacteria bacterium]|jgi:asparaginyl-tRNA synthetase|nr:asparagine--tRNA ligase [Candidatus Falkowbacteria bacterium]MBT6573779.1 asparagine--tRNA ligase [Candidatus Falkowbacteria bacterium]MBT7348131.1 asparagine--tRNA ligase [Candidatus Falkowbacteria bacterium]MBT7500717.1 asparagine--tRNA ligase [Candidatus Falkowbacteria bacterium]
MEQTYIKDFSEKLDQEVLIKGWVYNFRSSGKIAFLQVRDGSGFTQAVVAKDSVDEDSWQVIEQMMQESSVEVVGTVSKHPKKEEYELQVKKLNFIQRSEEYPIGNKEHGPDFLMENRHLWLRSPKQAAIQRVRTTVIMATYEFFLEKGFTKIDSPILTPAACEGTTELFEMEYFDLGKAYLSQSGQLYLEAAIASFGKVFDFGPTFRAEKSKTRRHLTEFWMMDAEMAFYDHEMSMQLQEDLICYIAKSVLEKNKAELEILERDVSALEKITAGFERLTYKQALEELKTKGSDIKDGEDLGNDDEDLIMKDRDKPIFIEKWPAEIKAFYMKRDKDNEDIALCSDVIAPEGHGEIIGGSQREDDYETLVKRIKEHKLPQEAFDWYLDLRKYGSVPHSGFGYGLERIVGWMCGTKHVRETIPFPRTINRIYP